MDSIWEEEQLCDPSSVCVCFIVFLSVWIIVKKHSFPCISAVFANDLPCALAFLVDLVCVCV